MANREHKGHGFYIENPWIYGFPTVLPLPDEPDEHRRLDLDHKHRWQWWRWSTYRDPNSRVITMQRLTIFRTPWLWLMLHWLVRGDQPALHTHWSWLFSIIWRGSYDEERVDGVKRRRFFNLVPRGVYHRIADTHGKVRTICLTGGPRDPVQYQSAPSLETP